MKWPLVLAECAGLAISVYLTLISFGVLHKDGVPCPRGSLFACHSILQGRHAYIGPVPISILGALYFAGQVMLTAMQKKKGNIRWIKFAGGFAGLVFVAYLRALEIVELKAICPWCWGVAVALLAELIFLYPSLNPTMPKMGISARILSTGCALLLLVGGGVAALNSFKTSSKSEVASAAPIEKIKDDKPAAEITAKPQARPKRTPKPATTATPENRRALPQPLIEDTKAVASTRPSPTPKPARIERTPEPEIRVPETPEIQVLRARGWRVVGESNAVIQLIQSRPPVLLLAYDSNCGECHKLIHNDLSTGELDGLRVTKVAIEESQLEGKVSDLVKNLPTLLLFDSKGVPLFKHEGRMSARQIMRNVQQTIGG